MDDWSDSDVEAVLNNSGTASCGRTSQDLFSERISQFSEFDEAALLGGSGDDGLEAATAKSKLIVVLWKWYNLADRKMEFERFFFYISYVFLVLTTF